MEKSPWLDDISVQSRYPSLHGKVLQVKMRGIYIKRESELKQFYVTIGGKRHRTMRPHPLQRALRAEQLATCRTVCKTRGFVTGGRSEIIVMSSVDDDDAHDPAPEEDLILAGQHAIIGFYLEAEASPDNEHIMCSLAEGVRITRIFAKSPKFVQKYFIHELNFLNSVKAGAVSFLEAYGEMGDINEAVKNALHEFVGGEGDAVDAECDDEAIQTP